MRTQQTTRLNATHVGLVILIKNKLCPFCRSNLCGMTAGKPLKLKLLLKTGFPKMTATNNGAKHSFRLRERIIIIIIIDFSHHQQ